MGKTNRGKDFEGVFKECCEKVDGVSIDRLHDQTNKFAGSSNICDFIAYKKPYEYYFECKSVHGNTLSIFSNPKKDKYGRLKGFYGNISDTQWKGLSEKSLIHGVFAGIVCWWVDKDVTLFIPIQVLIVHRNVLGKKSVRFDIDDPNVFKITGRKKRVFFDYDMQDFFDSIKERKGERE